MLGHPGAMCCTHMAVVSLLYMGYSLWPMKTSNQAFLGPGPTPDWCCKNCTDLVSPLNSV